MIFLERFCPDPPPSPVNGGTSTFLPSMSGSLLYESEITYGCGFGRKLYNATTGLTYDKVKSKCLWNQTWSPPQVRLK